MLKIERKVYTMEHKAGELMAKALEKMRELVDSQTIMGQPMKIDEKTTIIPVSKATFAFISGGTDFTNQKQKDLFGGAASSGASVTPVGFLVIQDGNVRLLQFAEGGQTVDRVLNMVPDVMTKVEGFFAKNNTTAKDMTDETVIVADEI